VGQEKSVITFDEPARNDQACVGQLTYGDKNKIFTYVRQFIRDFAQAENILHGTLLKVHQSNISTNTALARMKYALINMREMKLEEEINLSAD
jgi:hypothetical protein